MAFVFLMFRIFIFITGFAAVYYMWYRSFSYDISWIIVVKTRKEFLLLFLLSILSWFLSSFLLSSLPFAFFHSSLHPLFHYFVLFFLPVYVLLQNNCKKRILALCSLPVWQETHVSKLFNLFSVQWWPHYVIKMITVTLLDILHRHCEVPFINLEQANSQNGWQMKDQLDVTCYFISLIMRSTCFGH